MLRESMRRAASERRGEVKAKPEMMPRAAKPAERRLIRMLIEAEGFRARLAGEIRQDELHRGLETERVFVALLEAAGGEERLDPATLAEALEEKDRRLFFEVIFEPTAEPTWEEAESCLAVLRRRKVEAELAQVQRQIEAKPASDELRRLLARKQELRQTLAGLGG